MDEDFMTEKLNERILNKLTDADCDKLIKEFLLRMLYFELENAEEAIPQYSKFYDANIDQFAKRSKVDANET